MHDESILTMEQYKTTLFSRQSMKVKQNGFRTYKHQIYTETIEKIALSYNNDKSYIKDNNITTYSVGHYKIRNSKN
jgi:hypothetical protein